MDVGVWVINSLFIVGCGQCMGLFVGSGVGKSVLFGMMMWFIIVDIMVVGLIGECGCEVKEFIEYSLGEEGFCRFVVVVLLADDLFLMCMYGVMLVIVIVEYFWDQGKNVLLLMDFFICYVQV